MARLPWSNTENQDAQQYAAWGFDLLKYDRFSAGKLIEDAVRNTPGYHKSEFWKPMIEHLKSTDRDVIFNLCQYGIHEPWEWAPGIGANTWRIGGDLNHKVHKYIDQALHIATHFREYNRPGQWNDPDYMYVGRQVQTGGNHFVKATPRGLSTNQEYQYVTLWAVVCAPFTFSTDVLDISNFTVGLLSNPDVMEINQYELACTADVIRNKGSEVVMVKNLASGAKALAVFSRDGTDESVVGVSWSEIGEQSEREVWDGWRQKELGTIKDGIAVRLSPHGVGLFLID